MARVMPKVAYEPWIREVEIAVHPSLSFGFPFVADVVRLRRNRNQHRLSSCVRILTNVGCDFVSGTAQAVRCFERLRNRTACAVPLLKRCSSALELAKDIAKRIGGG